MKLLTAEEVGTAKTVTVLPLSVYAPEAVAEEVTLVVAVVVALATVPELYRPVTLAEMVCRGITCFKLFVRVITEPAPAVPSAIAGMPVIVIRVPSMPTAAVPSPVETVTPP
jgi:hypothetical protein